MPAARQSTMTRTQKIHAVALIEGIAPRTVWKRIKANELDLSAYDTLTLPIPRGMLPEAPPAPVTPAPPEPPALAPGELLDRLQQQAIELGELRERVKWLSADNARLGREVGLLKAPPDPPPAATAITPAPPAVGWWQRMWGRR